MYFHLLIKLKRGCIKSISYLIICNILCIENYGQRHFSFPYNDSSLQEFSATLNNFDKRFVIRTGINFPQGLQFFVGSEVKLLNRVTLNTLVGSSLMFDLFSWIDADPFNIRERQKPSLSAFISPELRYFFKVLDGNSHKKSARNFSGYYLSLKYFASTPSTNKDSTMNTNFTNISSWQIKIGGQIQVHKNFFGGFYGGGVISKSSINPSFPSAIPIFLFGISVGYVF